jgi:hypothetical protein
LADRNAVWSLALWTYDSQRHESMLRFHRISASPAAIFVAASSLALGVGGSSAPTILSRCHDPSPMVYDPKIDEIIPVEMVGGLESAVSPVQPGDKLTHHLRPWQVFC